ncbi:collagen triple helix [Elysia marginata]|uniref:Collagen triple helix n=1 Tax=Elysia marginata TaxID=1093978 RepID=A0AAV4FDB2_9GAST|nr:collagen triple helix [Elysia marginata]
MAGVQNRYKIHQKDRLWRFKCSKDLYYSYITGDCSWHYHINRLGHTLHYNVSRAMAIVGWDGMYSSVVKDRKFKFFECGMQRVQNDN